MMFCLDGDGNADAHYTIIYEYLYIAISSWLPAHIAQGKSL